MVVKSACAWAGVRLGVSSVSSVSSAMRVIGMTSVMGLAGLVKVIGLVGVMVAAVGGLAMPAAAQEAQRWADFPASCVQGREIDAPALVWPARLGGEGRRMGIVVEVDSPVKLRGSYVLVEGRARAETESPELVTLKERAGIGHALMFRGPGVGSWVYRVPRLPAPVDGESVTIKKSERNNAALTLRFTSARMGLKLDGGKMGDGIEQAGVEGGEVVQLDSTYFYFYDGKVGVAARGVVLMMPGLLGTPEGPMSKLTSQLCEKGWGVLRMVAQPARFVEAARFVLNADEPPQAQMGRLVELAGERSAECAYAVQSAFEYIEGKREGLAGLPRVAVGFSGGALTLPTVVAREPERYTRAVLVGGGANFFLMTLRTNYKHVTNIQYVWKVKGEDVPLPSLALQSQFSEAYLRGSPLDSYFTASVLRDKPTLSIVGDADYAVPTPLGTTLWERMGKPERIVIVDGSHERLFAEVPAYFERVVTFLNER